MKITVIFKLLSFLTPALAFYFSLILLAGPIEADNMFRVLLSSDLPRSFSASFIFVLGLLGGSFFFFKGFQPKRLWGALAAYNVIMIILGTLIFNPLSMMLIFCMFGKCV